MGRYRRRFPASTSITCARLRGGVRLLGTPIEAKEARPARTGDIRHSRADVTRLKQGLGYEERVAFEEGLRSAHGTQSA
jgi:hypothetical protein